MARIDLGMDGVELAANGGGADALFALGMFHATGLEVEADLVVAHKWFNLAAMRGNKAALERRKEISIEMSASQIAEAQRLAREWLATEKLGADRRQAERNAIEGLAAELATREIEPREVAPVETNVVRPLVWRNAATLAA